MIIKTTTAETAQSFPSLQRVVPASGGADQTPGSKEPSASTSPNQTTSNSTFDYLYEFSETRKVLEEFFKQTDNVNTTHDFQVSQSFRKQIKQTIDCLLC